MYISREERERENSGGSRGGSWGATFWLANYR